MLTDPAGAGGAVGRTRSSCSSSTSRSSRRWGGGCWRVAALSEKSHAGTSEGVTLRTRVLRTARQEGAEGQGAASDHPPPCASTQRQRSTPRARSDSL